MDKLHALPHEWVVVCDGRKALILENLGDERFPNLRCREEREQSNPPTHEQGTSAPGRVQQSVGTIRSAVQQTDWHSLVEQRFLGTLASDLDAAVAKGDAKAVIIVAPPRALGVLRLAYSSRLRTALKAEIEKDDVKSPIYEIEKQLFG
jgi:protein required for attachment to host cells